MLTVKPSLDISYYGISTSYSTSTACNKYMVQYVYDKFKENFADFQPNILVCKKNDYMYFKMPLFICAGSLSYNSITMAPQSGTVDFTSYEVISTSGNVCHALVASSVLEKSSSSSKLSLSKSSLVDTLSSSISNVTNPLYIVKSPRGTSYQYSTTPFTATNSSSGVIDYNNAIINLKSNTAYTNNNANMKVWWDIESVNNKYCNYYFIKYNSSNNSVELSEDCVYIKGFSFSFVLNNDKSYTNISDLIDNFPSMPLIYN